MAETVTTSTTDGFTICILMTIDLFICFTFGCSLRPLTSFCNKTSSLGSGLSCTTLTLLWVTSHNKATSTGWILTDLSITAVLHSRVPRELGVNYRLFSSDDDDALYNSQNHAKTKSFLDLYTFRRDVSIR